mmetsp:Transcript_68/g.355  ORF Transcript_68/g.355 Transcript_68/m.355 type:complete len:133 (-) Transcript_68:570-968(-)
MAERCDQTLHVTCAIRAGYYKNGVRDRAQIVCVAHEAASPSGVNGAYAKVRYAVWPRMPGTAFAQSRVAMGKGALGRRCTPSLCCAAAPSRSMKSSLLGSNTFSRASIVRMLWKPSARRPSQVAITCSMQGE